MSITWDCFKSTASDLQYSMRSICGYTPGTVLRQIRWLYLLKSACIYKYSACAVSYDILIFSKCAVSYWSGGNATRVTNVLPRANIKRNEMKKYGLLFYYRIYWSLRGAFVTVFIPAVLSNYWVPERKLCYFPMILPCFWTRFRCRETLLRYFCWCY